MFFCRNTLKEYITIPLSQVTGLYDVKEFDKDQPTAIYIHGFRESPHTKSIQVNNNLLITVLPKLSYGLWKRIGAYSYKYIPMYFIDNTAMPCNWQWLIQGNLRCMWYFKNPGLKCKVSSLLSNTSFPNYPRWIQINVSTRILNYPFATKFENRPPIE